MRGPGTVPLPRKNPGKVKSREGNRRSGVLLWPFQGWDSKGRGNRNPLPLAALFPHFGAAAKMGSRWQARNLSSGGAGSAPAGAGDFWPWPQKSPKGPLRNAVSKNFPRAVAWVFVAPVSHAITVRRCSSQQSRMPSALWTRYRFRAIVQAVLLLSRADTGVRPYAVDGTLFSVGRDPCVPPPCFCSCLGRTHRSRASTGPRGTSGCRGKYPWGAPARWAGRVCVCRRVPRIPTSPVCGLPALVVSASARSLARPATGTLP